MTMSHNATHITHTAAAAAAAHHTRLSIRSQWPQRPLINQSVIWLTSPHHCSCFRIFYSSFITCLPHNIRPHSHRPAFLVRQPRVGKYPESCRTIASINYIRRSRMQAYVHWWQHIWIIIIEHVRRLWLMPKPASFHNRLALWVHFSKVSCDTVRQTVTVWNIHFLVINL